MTAVAAVDACQLCGAPRRPWIVKQARQLFRCTGCRLVTVPAGVMLTANGVSIYEDDDNIFLQDGNDSYYLDETNYWSCRIKLNWLQKFLPEGARLLDAGANFGHFLKVAQDTYDAVGFDLSPQAVRWSREHLGVRNHAASIYDPPAELQGPFDGISCWDVVEHLQEPLRALEHLRELLEPGGYLFLSTPDAGSMVARVLGRHWYYLDPIQHIYLFNTRNLTRALEKSGFEVIEKRSFGRYYRLRYVFDRLAQLNRGGPLRWATSLGARLCRPVSNRAAYIKLGDVMGLAARRN